MGSGYSKRKKQAKAMQEQLMAMQEQMKDQEIEGSAGNGLVKVTVNGDGELKDIKIKPDCVDPDDVEGLEDLIRAAFSDATEKAKNANPMPDLGDMGQLGGLGGLGSLGAGLGF